MQQNWSRFPLLPNSKTPAYKYGQLSKGESAPIPEGYGVGIVTGSRSGIFVVDIDLYKGDVNEKLLEDLPDTYTTQTPRGGLHLYYRVPEGVFVKNSQGALAKNVDVRGEGGFVVEYAPVQDLPVADAPSWLLEKVTGSAHVKSATVRWAPVSQDDPTFEQRSNLSAKPLLTRDYIYQHPMQDW
jgi:hypothetical protein